MQFIIRIGHMKLMVLLCFACCLSLIACSVANIEDNQVAIDASEKTPNIIQYIREGQIAETCRIISVSPEALRREYDIRDCGYKWSIAEYACLLGNSEMLRMLLSKGATYSLDGVWQALWYACEPYYKDSNKRIACLKVLLEHDPSISSDASFCEDAMIRSAIFGDCDIECMEYLISCGGNPCYITQTGQRSNVKGWTLLDYAIAYGNKQIERLLRAHGAKLHSVTESIFSADCEAPSFGRFTATFSALIKLLC